MQAGSSLMHLPAAFMAVAKAASMAVAKAASMAVVAEATVDQPFVNNVISIWRET